jgi:predicted RNA polymerase sigma factor
MDTDFIPDDDQESAKQPHNSGEGCRALAEGSAAEAALSVVPNLRRRLEHSAATWTARAEMLERLARQRSERLSLAADEAEAATDRSA